MHFGAYSRYIFKSIFEKISSVKASHLLDKEPSRSAVFNLFDCEKNKIQFHMICYMKFDFFICINCTRIR